MSEKTGIPDFLLLSNQIQFIHLRKYDKINKKIISGIVMTYYCRKTDIAFKSMNKTDMLLLCEKEVAT